VTPLQLEGLKRKLEMSQKDLCASLQNRGSIAVERTPDLTDAADLAGERDIAMWSLDSKSVRAKAGETSSGASHRRHIRLLSKLRRADQL
jgi:hypothetical protein